MIALRGGTACARCYKTIPFRKLTLPTLPRTIHTASRSQTFQQKMPPKTASQQVSAYDTESDPLGAFHQRQNSNAAESSSQSTLTVKEVVGDIFDAPPNTVLIHACNCIGDWGAGIAAAFKKLYPSAYKFHRDFCANSADGKAQIATAQLIPPVDGQERRHYIGCLFTSVHYGRRRDSPDAILRNTGPAMEDLLRQLAEISKTMEVGEVRTCKINSGLFGVPWEKTLEVLQKIKLEPGMPTTVTVFERA